MFRSLRPRAFRAFHPVGGPIRYQSTSDSSFRLLTKVRSDVKMALKSRQKLRLQALRALLSEIDKAASSKRPIETNVALVTLIRQRCNDLAKARNEYTQQGREDLAKEADDEIEVLAEYGALESATTDEMWAAVGRAIESIQSEDKQQDATLERVMKFVKDGPLNDKFFLPSDLDVVRKDILSGKHQTVFKRVTK